MWFDINDILILQLKFAFSIELSISPLSNHLLSWVLFHSFKISGARSPVPELSFLPAPHYGWTRVGERRVQDNLHAHAQNAAIFPPKSGEKPYLEVLSRFGLWRDFLNDNIQATISAFRLIKNMSINPRSVEFHQCHTKPHSICLFVCLFFFITLSKITKEIFAKICWQLKTPTRI